MSDRPGTLELIGQHLALALRPLRDGLSDPAQFKQLMFRLGWKATALPPGYSTLFTTVDAALTKLEALGSNPSPNDISDLLQSVEAAYREIQAISTAPPGVDVSAFLAEIGERLFELLLTDYLAAELPALYHFLQMVNVIQLERVAAAAGRPSFVRLYVQWFQIPNIVTNPGGLPALVYGWGTSDLKIQRIIDHLAEFFFAIGLPVQTQPADLNLGAVYAGASGELTSQMAKSLVLPLYFGTIADQQLQAGFQIRELPATATELPGLILEPQIPVVFPPTLPLSDSADLKIRAGSDIASKFGILIRPDEISVKYPLQPAQELPRAGFGLAIDLHPSSKTILLGSPGATRLEVAGAEAGVQVNYLAGQLELILSAEARGLVLVLAAGEGDSFLLDLLGDAEKQIAIPLGIEWSSIRGIHFQGGSGFEVERSAHIELGPILVEAIQVRLFQPPEPGPRVRVQLGANMTGHLGPLTATVQGVGMQADLLCEDGNAGPFDIGLGFRLPDAIGLNVDAVGISGGGFIGHPAVDRYEGLLALKAGRVDIAAACLLQTGLAGDLGYSLLIALHATFPAIQVGLGFALTGVGGLIGLNRSVDVDVLRSRLAAGTAGRVLAPQDPIANAPALLDDLKAVFPPTAGVHVVGPTVQLNWADLVHFDVGVFIELPGPTRVVVLGSAHAEIVRDGRSYLTIRIDIVGEIDIPAKKVSFDAALVDSHLLGTLDLTGGAAFRLSLGAQPYSVLSLGGFHPAYNPEPLTFPASLTRIAMVHGSRGDELYLRFEGYFAITSNTLQFGAIVEALIHKGDFIIHGTLEFHALIQRVPFHFQFDIRAAVDVSYGSHRLAGLTLTGELSGPGPVVLRAKVCIELLFFDICFSHTFRLGPSTPPPLPLAPDLMTILLTELADPARLRGGGTDPYVQLRAADPANPDPDPRPVVVPTGALIWQQNTAPLQLVLDRVGGAPLPAPVEVRATALGASLVSDWFAPGQFINLDQDQALTRPGYELMYNGLLLADGDPIDGPAAGRDLKITEIRLPRRTPPRPAIDVTAFPPWLVGQRPPTPTPAIAVTPEKWTLTKPGGLVNELIGAQARRLADLNPAAQAVPSVDQLPTLVF